MGWGVLPSDSVPAVRAAGGFGLLQRSSAGCPSAACTEPPVPQGAEGHEELRAVPALRAVPEVPSSSGLSFTPPSWAPFVPCHLTGTISPQCPQGFNVPLIFPSQTPFSIRTAPQTPEVPFSPQLPLMAPRSPRSFPRPCESTAPEAAAAAAVERRWRVLDQHGEM